MQRIAGVVLGWTLLLGWATESLAERPLTVRGVVAAYRNYLSSIRNVSFRALLKDRYANERDFHNSQDDQWNIDLVGHRCWTGALIMNCTPKAGRSELRFWEVLTTVERQISLSSDPKTMRAELVCDYLKGPPESWIGWGYPVPLGYLDTSREGASQRLGDLLTGSLTVKWQTGKPVVLTSQTAERRLTLWLDRSKGWMPERIEYRRLAPAAEAYQPTRLSYAVQQAVRVDGIWFPTKFTVEETQAGGKMQMPDGLVEREETVVEDGVEQKVVVAVLEEGVKGEIIDVAETSRVAQLELADVRINALSDADFQLKATIPDGTEVGMQDDIFKEYVWQDGKPVVVPRQPPLFESFFGRQPPELEITDARGVPKSIQLADLRGKWVVIEFWALSCGNCIEGSLPELAKFYREHQADRERFEILAICANWQGDVAAMDEFDRRAAPIIEKNWNGQPLPFPVLLDGDEKTFAAFGIQGVPKTLLVDPQGNLVGGGDLKMLAEKLSAAGQ